MQPGDNLSGYMSLLQSFESLLRAEDSAKGDIRVLKGTVHINISILVLWSATVHCFGLSKA